MPLVEAAIQPPAAIGKAALVDLPDMRPIMCYENLIAAIVPRTQEVSMAKNKNRVQHKSADSSKTAQEQSKSAGEQMENTQAVGKTERKRQAKKFGHN